MVGMKSKLSQFNGRLNVRLGSWFFGCDYVSSSEYDKKENTKKTYFLSGKMQKKRQEKGDFDKNKKIFSTLHYFF